ncbi:MAG: flagellar export protein FliJ, partial [Lysobacteraceae bacterium]
MNSKRLDPLLRRAENREDALAKELAKRVQAHPQQAQRLGDLERFRGEYAPPPAAGSAVTPG